MGQTARMVSYGAVDPAVTGETGRASNRGRSPGLAVAAAALCAFAIVAATASWTQSQGMALEQFEVVPLGAMGQEGRQFSGLMLGDDTSKILPWERVYETDGLAPPAAERCPGAWCEKTPSASIPTAGPRRISPSHLASVILPFRTAESGNLG